MFHHFKNDISAIASPTLFTWPFHYTPHRLSLLAAQQVQEYIATQEQWHEQLREGKMFGVLVVEHPKYGRGFLAAFSGNLQGKNLHPYFTPPIYDMLQPEDFFRQGEAEITLINEQIRSMLSSEEYALAKEHLETTKQQMEETLAHLKEWLRSGKAQRNERRKEGEQEEVLILESQRQNAEAQRLKRKAKEQLLEAQQRVENFQAEINKKKELRQTLSARLQQRLFSQFILLNAKGQTRNLCDIFAQQGEQIPPAGAGECAAPKLLQYAYSNNLKPIAMAEFWWGESPRGEVRRHGEFYPSCNSKCKPILGFMLQGLDVEPNPLLEIKPQEPEIVWEDEHLVVINKPEGMLSVKGKTGVRSAQEWAEERYAEAMIVHRLDQATSGLMVIAKHKTAHEALQKQFISRSVKKCYIALLDGVITPSEGEIRLPLKLDYDNRPRQKVDEDGRKAHTIYKVESITDGKTRIRFYPITGRTHQLRVHAAHHLGLGAPIIGDDLYGKGGERLCLHAATLEFQHPVSEQIISLQSAPEF